jgi:hypothetical protein
LEENFFGFMQAFVAPSIVAPIRPEGPALPRISPFPASHPVRLAG